MSAPSAVLTPTSPFDWQACLAALPSRATPAPIHLSLVPSGAALGHLGGTPALDQAFDWPSATACDSDEILRPRLAAQIDCARLPHESLLPSAGVLLFFEPHRGYQAGSARGAIVTYLPEARALLDAGNGQPLVLATSRSEAQLFGEAEPLAGWDDAPEEGLLLLALPKLQYRIRPDDLRSARFDRVHLAFLP